MKDPDQSDQSPNIANGDPTVWLDFIPLAWLALVTIAFTALALAPFAPLPDSVPGVDHADRAVLPLLAALGAAGIIRYFRLRASRPSGDAAGDDLRLEEGDHP